MPASSQSSWMISDDGGSSSRRKAADSFGTQEHAVGPARIAAMLPVDPYFVGSHFDYRYRRQTHGALLQMAGIRRGVIGLCIASALVEPVHLLRSQRQGPYMLGHKNAAMTLDTYADLFDTDLDDVATSISSKITAAEILDTRKF